MRKHEVKSKTKDNKEFEFNKTYYYWDGREKQVFADSWETYHVESCGTIVMSAGYRIPINILRENRNDALLDGQLKLKIEMDNLQKISERLESEKK